MDTVVHHAGPLTSHVNYVSQVLAVTTCILFNHGTLVTSWLGAGPGDNGVKVDKVLSKWDSCPSANLAPLVSPNNSSMMLPLLFLTALVQNVSAARKVPEQALAIDWKGFIALENPLPPSIQNFSTVCFSSPIKLLLTPFRILFRQPSQKKKPSRSRSISTMMASTTSLARTRP